MIRLSKASVDESEIEELKKVFFETTNFGLGVHVDQFEKELQSFIGGGVEVVCVNTGTSALQVALAACEFKSGSEVLVPTITFAASYVAIMAAGLVPVSCEVKYPDMHVDVADAKSRVTSKTVAIMPVAYSGTDFDRAALYLLAKEAGLKIIEDDAHAFGSLTANGKMFGSEGEIVCFSFDGIKNITCGEGGAIVTKDKKLAQSCRVLRSLGIEKDVELRYQGQRAWEYDIEKLGFRFHMSNINAAIGTAQLRKFESFRKKKAELAASYFDSFEKHGVLDFITPTQKQTKDACLHIMSCLLPAGTNRSDFRSKMKEKGFETGFHYVPNHQHTLFKSKYALPVSENAGERLISFPFHPEVAVASVEGIVLAAKQIILGS
jgi:dTDP-4-amino-4,6-dideoxygalactose transaminase